MILMPEYGRYQVVNALRIAALADKGTQIKVDFCDSYYHPLLLDRDKLTPPPLIVGDYLLRNPSTNQLSYLPRVEFENTFRKI